MAAEKTMGVSDQCSARSPASRLLPSLLSNVPLESLGLIFTYSATADSVR